MAIKPIKPKLHKQDVISHLPDCKIFHFAGHGYTDDIDPLRSYLCLQDWKENPLVVADLLEINLRARSPFLAYLSACGSGRINDLGFSDESIHLISACQIAGFRHVIGTLWEVRDDTCVEMAAVAYEVMLSGGMSDESVCRGLHKASRQLRDRWLSKDTATKQERASIVETAMASKDHEPSPFTRGGNGTRLPPPRDGKLLISGGGKVMKSLLWVPYVHFGV